ncbi:flagellar biosynthesis anti-sigma factor FlgM [Burkholderia semiarida]|uniref:Flagellar biosynthesis anti-sigma factor FlgM n=1 Tax=Burkholderia semiarida TaxID=2843303 RepID=A0ABW7LBN4_9BURK
MLRIATDARPIEMLEQATAAERGATPAAASRNARPTLTPDLHVLRAGQAGLESGAEFDAARVAEIKAALEAGDLPFDVVMVARHMRGFHGRGT